MEAYRKTQDSVISAQIVTGSKTGNQVVIKDRLGSDIAQVASTHDSQLSGCMQNEWLINRSSQAYISVASSAQQDDMLCNAT